MLALLLISMVMLGSGTSAQDAVTYYKQGDTFQTSGQFVEAVKSYDKAIELDNKYVDAFIKRGQCKRQLKPPDYNGSLVDLSRAIKLDPKSFVAYNSRGGTYKAMMKYDLAMSDFNKAIELDSKSEKALYNRGTLWLDTKEYTKAVADLTLAINRVPSYVFSYFQRAKAYQALKRDQDALADYDKAVSMEPKYADAMHYRSILKQAMGDIQGAIADSRKAVEIDPKSNLYKAQLGDLLNAKPVDATVADTPDKPIASVNSTSIPITFLPDKPDDIAIWNNPATPWQKGATPITGNLTAAEMNTNMDFSTLDFDGYQSAVMAAMGSMRLVYGDMAPEEEGRFQAGWSPLIDFPTPIGLGYLNKMNPLLQEFLRLRSVMVSTAMQFDEAWTEAGVAAGFGLEDMAAGALQNANVYKQGLVNLKQRMDAVVQQITVLGDPPNPIAAKQRARKKLVQTLKSLPFVQITPANQTVSLGQPCKFMPTVRNMPAATKLSWTFGDGKSAVKPSATSVSYAYAKQGTYTVKLVVTDAKTGAKVGASEAKVTIGDAAPRGRYVLIDVTSKMEPEEWLEVTGGLGSITETHTSHEDPKDSTKETGSCSVEYSWTNPPSYIDPKVNTKFTSRTAFKSRSGRWSITVQGLNAALQFFKTDQVDIMNQIWTGQFNSLSMMDMVSIGSTSFLDEPRISTDGPKTEWHEKPGKYPQEQTWTAESDHIDTKDCPFAMVVIRVSCGYHIGYTCYKYKYDPTGVEQAISLAKIEQASKEQIETQTAQQAAANAQEQSRKDAIAGHTSTIAFYTTSITGLRSQLATETNPDRTKELNSRIVDALTEIQHEKDLIASIQTGTIVHNRTVAEDVQHTQLINSCFRDIQISKQIQDNALRARNFFKAADNLQALINILPQAEAAQLREWANKKLDVKAMVNRDSSKLKQISSAVLNVVQGKNLGDEAQAMEAINTLEEIKWGASTALIVVAPFAAAEGIVVGSTLAAQAPSWIATGYGIGTGYIEGGPKQAIITGARFYSSFVDVAMAGMEGYQAEEGGGVSGAAKNVAITLLMRKGSELSAKQLMQGRLKANQPVRTWKEVVEDADFEQAKQDGQSLVKKYQGDQDAFDAMVNKNKPSNQKAQEYIAANANSLAKTKEGKVLTESLATVESSYTAKMAINEQSISAATKQNYNQNLELFMEKPVVDRTKELMKQRGWNDFEMNQIRHGANINKVGRDHDLAVQEEGFDPQKGGQKKTIMEFQQELELCLKQAYQENSGGRTSKMADWKATTSVDPEAYIDKSVLNLNKLRDQGGDPYSMLNKDLAEQTGGVNLYKVKTALAKGSREGTAEACRTLSKELDTKILPSCPKGSSQAIYFLNLKKALDKGATDPRNGEMMVYGITGIRLEDLAYKIKFELMNITQTGKL